ncbi:MAG: type II toxin-antitoxin system Phd/YefM family antitoxin [Vulcanimicrobiaceae bacterium]
MKTVGAFEAKTHLPELLKQAEAGQTIVVTRHGRPVAQISPVVIESPGVSPREAMQRLRCLGLRIDRDEIRGLRDAGRRA